ncbi:8917_t:CDS:2, partial [Diversispora eburnea]
MQQQLEGQRIEIEDLKKRLQKVYEDRTKIHNLYDEQYKKNEQKHIETIIEIAKAERESLFGDVKSLIGDNE